MIDKFKNLSLAQKKAAVAAAAGLAVFLIGLKVVIEKDLNVLKDLRRAAAENAPKTQVAQETEALEKKIRSYEEFLSKIRQADWLIDQVNTYAAESGITLLSVVPQPAADGKEDYARTILTIEAGGNFHQFGRFVEKIENHRPLIKILTIKIFRGESATQKMTMTLASFYSKQGAS